MHPKIDLLLILLTVALSVLVHGRLRIGCRVIKNIAIELMDVVLKDAGSLIRGLKPFSHFSKARVKVLNSSFLGRLGLRPFRDG